jgi:FkbM family methyltransferase
MTFISYAQNFEDVMLWRALKHVENGFYIDVGANDPTLYSVTRAFYDAGWKGINIEPVPQFFDRLNAARPRDINLQMGAGAKEGSFPFFDIPDSGLATSDPTVAEMHRKNGWDIREIAVQVLPLARICEKHVTADIHFLKIDVEGAERDVLLGMDFQQWRPWVVVVEATVPMSQETVHQAWEPLLLDANYEFVYFDGLNRYYVAAEHAELKLAFSTPPNVFDDFMLNIDQESKSRANEAETRAYHSRQQMLEARRKRKEAEAQAQAAQTEVLATEIRLRETTFRLQQADTLVAAILSSRSWKITAPLREAGAIARLVRNALRQAMASPRGFAVRALRALLRRAIPVVQRHPFLLTCARGVKRLFPTTMNRIIFSFKSVSTTARNEQMQRITVMRDDPPAWGGTVSSADQFKALLSDELQRRTKSKH